MNIKPTLPLDKVIPVLAVLTLTYQDRNKGTRLLMLQALQPKRDYLGLGKQDDPNVYLAVKLGEQPDARLYGYKIVYK